MRGTVPFLIITQNRFQSSSRVLSCSCSLSQSSSHSLYHRTLEDQKESSMKSTTHSYIEFSPGLNNTNLRVQIPLSRVRPFKTLDQTLKRQATAHWGRQIRNHSEGSPQQQTSQQTGAERAPLRPQTRARRQRGRSAPALRLGQARLLPWNPAHCETHGLGLRAAHRPPAGGSGGEGAPRAGTQGH